MAPLSVLVRCTSCDQVYALRGGRLRVVQVQGCPGCGDVGWRDVAAEGDLVTSEPRRGVAAGAQLDE